MAVTTLREELDFLSFNTIKILAILTNTSYNNKLFLYRYYSPLIYLNLFYN